MVKQSLEFNNIIKQINSTHSITHLYACYYSSQIVDKKNNNYFECIGLMWPMNDINKKNKKLHVKAHDVVK